MPHVLFISRGMILFYAFSRSILRKVTVLGRAAKCTSTSQEIVQVHGRGEAVVPLVVTLIGQGHSLYYQIPRPTGNPTLKGVCGQHNTATLSKLLQLTYTI